MSAVIESLRKLEQAVGSLENSVGSVEIRNAGTQRDMFGGPDVALGPNGEPVRNGSVHLPEAEIIAKRLDFAITKVEEILREEA